MLHGKTELNTKKKSRGKKFTSGNSKVAPPGAHVFTYVDRGISEYCPGTLF